MKKVAKEDKQKQAAVEGHKMCKHITNMYIVDDIAWLATMLGEREAST